MKNIVIINCPVNLGLIEPSPGMIPGVAKLPDWLQKHGLEKALNPVAVHRINAPVYSMQIDPESGVRNADAIISFAKEQAQLIYRLLENNTLPIVVGGDCSILIGNALALKARGNYALLFLDGHTDFSWPGLSQTNAAAGMDLAIVTGNGHEKLVNIDGLGPYIKEECAWSFGNRDYNKAYTDEIEKSPIHYFDLNRLRREGIANCVNQFLRFIQDDAIDGFWIHIDVDVLNDDLMPAVDSRQDGGLNFDEFKKVLVPLLAHQKISGLEITILDPDLDRDGGYAKSLIKSLAEIFELARS